VLVYYYVLFGVCGIIHYSVVYPTFCVEVLHTMLHTWNGDFCFNVSYREKTVLNHNEEPMASNHFVKSLATDAYESILLTILEIGATMTIMYFIDVGNKVFSKTTIITIYICPPSRSFKISDHFT
jgi:hypothetical protein